VWIINNVKNKRGEVMKNRAFLNWLIIFLSSVAFIGLCFTPAFADEPGDEMEVQDGTFGQRYQTTWVTAYEFVPIRSGESYSINPWGYMETYSPTSLFVAAIRLPSGAYLDGARFYYYDNDVNSSPRMHIYRQTVPLQGSTNNPIELCKVDPPASATPGYSSGLGNCTGGIDTIKNVDNTYKIGVYLDSTYPISFYGVRLWWWRQIRTGLSHPFTDIGHLSQNFRDSIAALYQSGITTGTTPTTYSPGNPVTRAQMAAFLTRALGLHWDIGDGY
jgi:S-layer homology domain